MSNVPAVQARVNHVAEAICSGLHRTDFKFLGETNGGLITWFSRGDYPKQLRVRVERSTYAAEATATVEGRNLHAPEERRKVSMTFGADVNGSEQKVFEATETVVLRILETYQDLTQGTGAFGPEAWKPRKFASTADSAMPDTDEDEADADL